jgi:hypothetical protein
MYMAQLALSRKGNIAPEKAADRPPPPVHLDERRLSDAAAAMSHRRR